ncbi:MAG: NifU family protein [Treponema sp.]|nr:NifU family protein [Treponema sp.]
MEEYIKTHIAPRIMGDGGWVEYTSLENNELSLIFRGECSKCFILNRCCAWIESEIKKDLHQDVHIKAQVIKPFFWDFN